MDNSLDIRWLQRFDNYQKALNRLEQAIQVIKSQSDSEPEIELLLQEGLIQRFEYTQELAWKVMKDYAEYQGETEITGSRDAIRKALETGLIDDKRWLDTIADRNQTSHRYDDEVADEVTSNTIHVYFPLFKQFEQRMKAIAEKL